MSQILIDNRRKNDNLKLKIIKIQKLVIASPEASGDETISKMNYEFLTCLPCLPAGRRQAGFNFE
jgi:hypothetical protein